MFQRIVCPLLKENIFTIVNVIDAVANLGANIEMCKMKNMLCISFHFFSLISLENAQINMFYYLFI